MRVLIVADVVGGVRTFVAELAGALARSGVEVHLGLIGSVGIAAPDDVCSLEIRDLRLEWMPDPWPDVAAAAEWIEELRVRYRPDVIHMNTFGRILDQDVPVLLSVHSCVLTWWRAVHGRDAPSRWRRYAQLAHDAFARATIVCTPTHALLHELAAVYGDLPRARVIPNGRAVRPPEVQRHDRLVVSAGRLWDEAKNAALTARAAPTIDGRVVLIGPGEVAGVECTGGLSPDEVVRWFARASVFAAPARYEPFGLAALEAALCGCALVLGDVPSLHEVWGDAATFVGLDDPDGLARAVGELLDDPPRCRRAGNRARAVAARYTPAATADAYLAAYRELTRVGVTA